MSLHSYWRHTPATGVSRNGRRLGISSTQSAVCDEIAKLCYEIFGIMKKGLEKWRTRVKTQTKQGAFKILWTADTVQAQREINVGYEPTHDNLLINIFWGEYKESVFYIPLFVQEQIYEQIGRGNYLQVKSGSNHRGVEITGRTATRLRSHPETLKLAVNWITNGEKFPEPWKEWAEYWKRLQQ